MSISTYTPPAGTVVHETGASLDSREIPAVVHLVQYDRTTPVIAVRLAANSQPYAVPDGAVASIRLRKPDGKNVYDPALGLSEDRSTVYMEVTRQMTAVKGRAKAVLEIANAEGVVGTSHFEIEIDQNPIQEADIVSSDEYKTVVEIMSEVEENARKAAASQEAAKASEDAAKKSQAAAQESAEAAADSAQSAENSAGLAAASEAAAADSAEQASASETEAGKSADAAGKSAAEAEDWSNTSKSWAIGEGLGEKRPDEATDNAKVYAEKAQASAESAAGSVKVVEENADVLRTVQDNLEGILAAPDAADRAEAAADSAEFDAQRAEEAAQRAQSIAQGAKGYYETPETLRQSIPDGTVGDWAIVGSTDTIWVWDSDSGGWKDSHQATDLSNYYTKEQADAELNELQSAMTKETDEKLAGKANSTDLKPLETGITEAKTAAASATSRTWTVSVGAAAWVSGSDTWSGITAGYKAEVTASGMTEATQIGSIAFAGGDLTSAGLWRYLRPGAGKVTLYSEEKPAKDFSLTLVEVK